MYRNCSSRLPIAGLVLGVLAFAALALPAPAAAQGGSGGGRQERPERPFRGLFGSAPTDGTTGSTLAFTATANAGYDDNIVSDQPGLDPRVAVAGGVYNTTAGLVYSHNTGRTSVGMNANASYRFFPEDTDLNAANYSAGIGVERELNRRTRLTLGQNVAYVPYYQFSLFPGLLPPDLGSTVPSNLDYAVTPQESWILNSNIELNRELGRKSSLRMFYGFGFQDMASGIPTTTIPTSPSLLLPPQAPPPEPASDLTTHSAGFQFRRSLTRYAGVRLGYAYRSGGYQFSNAADVTAHNIDIGVDYARSLSIFRRTTFSFSTGSSIVQIDDERHFRVIGDAALNHMLSRSWTARLAYSRGMGYVASFNEPFFTDSVSASVGGFVGRRLNMSLIGNFASGDLGVASSTGNGVKSYSANFTAQYAFTQFLAADFSAYTYKYDFSDDTSALPAGLPGQFERSGVRAGLSLWLPLIR